MNNYCQEKKQTFTVHDLTFSYLKAFNLRHPQNYHNIKKQIEIKFILCNRGLFGQGGRVMVGCKILQFIRMGYTVLKNTVARKKVVIFL